MESRVVVRGGEIKAVNPGVSWTWLINLLVAVLAPVVGIMSKEIRDALVKFLTDLRKKARETPNPWDDFVTEFILRILGA